MRMTRLAIIVWSLTLAACLSIKPPVVTPPVDTLPPVVTPPVDVVRTVAVNLSGQCRVGATVVIEATVGGVPAFAQAGITDANGYVPFHGVTARADGASVKVTRDGCVPATVTFEHIPATNYDLPTINISPARPRVKTWAETSNGVCNFGSALDREGRHIFTPFLAPLWEQNRISELEDWLTRLAGENNNCLVLSIEAARGYRDYFLPAFDYRGDLARFDQFLSFLQGYAAGDGAAWRFVVNITSGDGDRQEAWSEVAPTGAALKSRVPIVIWSNGFETLREWKPINLSRWWTEMHAAFGDGARLMAWGMPGAVPAASFHGDGTRAECEAQDYNWIDYDDARRPGIGGCVDRDDPWQGKEPDSTSSHGAEWVTDWAYQWEHGSAVLDPCGRTIFDGTKGKDGQPVAMYPPCCGMNRFDDGVARIGAGICSDDYGANGPKSSPCSGWGRKHFWAMETDTMDAFQGRSSPAIAEMVANQAELVFLAYGVNQNYGSGGPTSWRKKR